MKSNFKTLTLISALILIAGFWGWNKTMALRTSDTQNQQTQNEPQTFSVKPQNPSKAAAEESIANDLPALPSSEDLKDSGMEVGLNRDGSYHIAPAGGAEVYADLATAGNAESWSRQEDSLLQDINEDRVELTEADTSAIAAWKKQISGR